MQVQLNPKSVVRSVEQFVALCGGNTQHAQTLEFVAGLCGFSSYRALKAADDVRPADAGRNAATATTTAATALRAIENPAHVVFRSTAVDWELADNPQANLDDVSSTRRTEYAVVVEAFGSQFRVLMKPQGVDIDTFDGKPVMDLLIEVNDGLPCVHMTNDPAGEMLMSVFFAGEGLVVRSDESRFERSNATSGVLRDIASRNGELANTLVAAHDTGAVYAGIRHAAGSADSPTGSAAGKFMGNTADNARAESYPSAHLPLSGKPNPALQGARVDVSFDDTVHTGDEKLYLDVSLVQANGDVQDDDHVGLFSSFSMKTGTAVLRKTTQALAEVVVYFLEGGYSLCALESVIIHIGEAPAPDDLAQRAVEAIRCATDPANAMLRVCLLFG